jgi:hypothetical protein
MARSSIPDERAHVNRVGASLRTGRKPPAAFSSNLVPKQCSTRGCKIVRMAPENAKLTCEFCVMGTNVIVQARR